MTIIYCAIAALIGSALTILFCYKILFQNFIVKLVHREYEIKDEQIEKLNSDYYNVSRSLSSVLKTFSRIIDKKRFDDYDLLYFKNLQDYTKEFLDEETLELRKFECNWYDRRTSIIEGSDFATAFNANHLPFEFDSLENYREIFSEDEQNVT